MRKPTDITTTLLILFLLFWNNNSTFSQQFTDELMAKLPRIDQYKLLKAETFNKKGKSFLEKGGSKPESAVLEDTTLSEKEEGKIDNYYVNRIKASYCFRDANGLLYYVVDKYIKSFWKKYKNDKKPLELFIKVENAAYDSLLKADKLREKAEKEQFIADKVPLVSSAEAIEEKALFRLEKILFIYMNWPESPNIPWLFSDDATDPRIPELNKEIQLSSIQLDLDSAKKDTIHKATSIYNLMHISENQIDAFNEFLKTKYPDKAEAYLIDFQKLHNDAIDSLHRKWQEYSFGSKLESDANPSNLFSGVNSSIQTEKPSTQDKNRLIDTNPNRDEQNKQQETISINTIQPEHQLVQKTEKAPIAIVAESSGFLYKVQISASRQKMSARELQKIYSGDEEIVESFEDKWFKYTIGRFTLYRRASSLKGTINVRGAFVIAYFNGKRIKITTDMAKPEN